MRRAEDDALAAADLGLQQLQLQQAPGAAPSPGPGPGRGAGTAGLPLAPATTSSSTAGFVQALVQGAGDPPAAAAGRRSTTSHTQLGADPAAAPRCLAPYDAPLSARGCAPGGGDAWAAAPASARSRGGAGAPPSVRASPDEVWSLLEGVMIEISGSQAARADLTSSSAQRLAAQQRQQQQEVQQQAAGLSLMPQGAGGSITSRSGLVNTNRLLSLLRTAEDIKSGHQNGPAGHDADPSSSADGQGGAGSAEEGVAASSDPLLEHNALRAAVAAEVRPGQAQALLYFLLKLAMLMQQGACVGVGARHGRSESGCVWGCRGEGAAGCAARRPGALGTLPCKGAGGAFVYGVWPPTPPLPPRQLWRFLESPHQMAHAHARMLTPFPRLPARQAPHRVQLARFNATSRWWLSSSHLPTPYFPHPLCPRPPPRPAPGASRPLWPRQRLPAGRLPGAAAGGGCVAAGAAAPQHGRLVAAPHGARGRAARVRGAARARGGAGGRGGAHGAGAGGRGRQVGVWGVWGLGGWVVGG